MSARQSRFPKGAEPPLKTITTADNVLGVLHKHLEQVEAKIAKQSEILLALEGERERLIPTIEAVEAAIRESGKVV